MNFIPRWTNDGLLHKHPHYVNCAEDCEMGIRILSDLHLEIASGYDEFNIPNPSNTRHLALLGDIGNVSDHRLFKFLTRQLQSFEVVLFLAGNHEAYGSSYPKVQSSLTDFADSITSKRAAGWNLGEFILLDRRRYDITPSTTILGCTLFSHVPEAQKDHVYAGMNDFYKISDGDWTVDQHNEAHANDLSWLNEQVSSISATESNRQIIIFTHHSPTIDPRSFNAAHAHSKIGSAFATDLSREPCWTSDKVTVWAFGHTHFNCDYFEGKKRVVTNQKGYYFAQSAGFDESKVLEVAK